jgi:DNA-binding MarR family transcriptional regulator
MDISGQKDKAPVLKDLPSRLLGQAASLVGRVTEAALAEAGAHRYQFAVLATLDAFGAASQADLCRRTDLDRSDMNAVVGVLEAGGAVTRAVDPANRRQNIVALTAKGRARFEELRALVHAAQETAFAPLSAADRKALVRLLERLRDGLTADRS